jgi:tRNA/tmRNA/rRNA uracil-C5-methylase (TrmA/RlmC/RlmD family)
LPLAGVLQYAIIKGNYLEQTILFNVRASTPAVVHAVNQLSRKITAQFGSGIAGVFLFEGEPEGRYYLAPREAGAVPRIRKIFGKNRLFVRIEGRPFLYPPLVFSQVNESLLDLFVGGVRTLLSPARTETLLDLYCGYGLFALSLAPLVQRVIGAETSPLAVAAAAENARLQKVSHARFVRTHLSSESVRTVTARVPDGTPVILDPPRSGTAGGVIEALAVRRPRKVVHVFCNMEVLTGELLRWKKAGYEPEQAIPFDMFPGTPELEIMVLLTPAPRPGI